LQKGDIYLELDKLCNGYVVINKAKCLRRPFIFETSSTAQTEAFLLLLEKTDTSQAFVENLGTSFRHFQSKLINKMNGHISRIVPF